MIFKFSLAILVIAVLTSSISSSAFAQTNGTDNADNNQNFEEFFTCMLDDNNNGTVSEAEISAALDATNNAPTEQEIRDCFQPIYTAGNTGGNTNDDTDEGETEN
jgi:hypothetical protein